MLLHLTDYHLEACRNIRRQLENEEREFVVIELGKTLTPNREVMDNRFKQHLVKAEKLIEQTGYHRCGKALRELKNPTLERTVFMS